MLDISVRDKGLKFITKLSGRRELWSVAPAKTKSLGTVGGCFLLPKCQCHLRDTCSSIICTISFFKILSFFSYPLFLERELAITHLRSNLLVLVIIFTKLDQSLIPSNIFEMNLANHLATVDLTNAIIDEWEKISALFQGLLESLQQRADALKDEITSLWAITQGCVWIRCPHTFNCVAMV